jgi:hypothetical protein
MKARGKDQQMPARLVLGSCFPSNSDSLDFADADIIVAAILEASGLRVRMPGHALRDLDPALLIPKHPAR